MADSTTTYNPLTRPAAALVGGSSSTAQAKSAPVIKFEDYDFNPGGSSYSSKLSQGSANPAVGSAQDLTDWRVRVSLPPGNNKELYNALDPDGGALLKAADGVLFPYTPAMTVTHNARYNEQALTHSNYKGYFYEGSDVAAISLTGVFTAQNEKEALYIQSCINFLRACTKMRFGPNDPKSGQPPTLVRLSGYGSFYMPSVSCVVTSFSHTMPEDIDYIPFMVGGRTGRVPIASTVTLTLQPVVSRQRQSQNFNLADFVAGKYVSGGVGNYTTQRRDDNPGGIL